MLKSIYIIDTITLFNPKRDRNIEVYKYEEIERYKRELAGVGIVYFLTGDTESVLNVTGKMLYIFKKIKPFIIMIEDGISQKKITLVQLVKLLLKREKEKKGKEKLLECINEQIKKLGEWDGEKKLRNNLSPMYIKTTMCYGIEVGGAVAHCAGVLKVLSSRYEDLVVYTTDYIPKELRIKELHHISMKGFHDFSELSKMYLNFTAYKEICRIEDKRVPSFIYQRCDMHDFLGLKLSRKYKVPFILEFNGSVNWICKNWGSKLIYSRQAEYIERINLEKADLIVCVSDESKDVLIEQGIASKKILVVYNGVDEEKYTPDADGKKIIDQYELNKKVVIGFYGSFGKFHGVEKLAEAYGNLILHNEEYRNNTCLLLMGEGATLPDVKKILKRYKADDCVRYAGSVPFEDMPSYLAACDILVAPHIRNKDGTEFFGSPTKLFEYMAMGKAIAASNLNQIGSILTNEKNALLFEPENIKNMEQVLIRLIEDAGLRDRLGKNARHEVVEKYTWDKHVNKILEKLMEMYKEETTK